MSDHYKDGHGMDHMERALWLGDAFAIAEGADRHIVKLAILLHDVDDYKIVGLKNSAGLPNARAILQQAGVDDATQAKVLDIIGTMGYGNFLKGIRPATLEGAIVSDADMCDAIGANGIIRTYAYSSSKGKPFFNKNIFPIEDFSAADAYTKEAADSSVSHFFEKLLKLKNLMLTPSGKREAIQRHEMMVAFLRQLFIEENTPEWTVYLEKYLKTENKKEADRQTT